MDRKRIGRLIGLLRQNRYGAIALALGVLLLCLPRAQRQETAQDAETVFDLAREQREMERILSSVHGAGRLALMLTLESAEETELAQNSYLSYRGSSAAPEDYERRSETVVLGSGSGAHTLVTGTAHPRYRGALIVCEGGEDASVRLALTEAVRALTGLGSDRITVVGGTPGAG